MAEFLSNPPDWFVRQAAACIREGLPKRLVNPLATAVSTQLYDGDPWHWQEVLPFVEEWLRRENAT